MEQNKGKRKFKSIIFNKWALISLGIFIILLLLLAKYNEIENSISTDLYGGKVSCHEKKSPRWNKMRIETKLGVKLYLSKSLSPSDCRSIKSSIDSRNTKAYYLKSNGLVLKLENLSATIYEAGTPYFSIIMTAIVLWLIPLSIIEMVNDRKHAKKNT